MNYIDKKIIVGVSGGKDSSSVCLNLLEQGYTKNQFERVFLNTGWEHSQTYEYLNELETTIGNIKIITEKIEVKEEYKEHVEYFEKKLGFESPMIRRIFKYLIFPSRLVKYCTTDFKIKPLKKYFDTLDEDYVNVIGIRKEESLRRSKLEEWEYNDFFDCYVHRPIINWTEKDVIDIHKRFNLTPNRLYLKNHSRVGCYPCIMSNKREIRHLEQSRIDLINELEVIVSDLYFQKTGKKQERTFFQSRYKGSVTKIHDVVNWSKTSRGGKQLQLFDTEERTCVKWGMCNV